MKNFYCMVLFFMLCSCSISQLMDVEKKSVAFKELKSSIESYDKQIKIFIKYAQYNNYDKNLIEKNNDQYHIMYDGVSNYNSSVNVYIASVLGNIEKKETLFKKKTEKYVKYIEDAEKIVEEIISRLGLDSSIDKLKSVEKSERSSESSIYKAVNYDADYISEKEITDEFKRNNLYIQSKVDKSDDLLKQVCTQYQKDFTVRLNKIENDLNNKRSDALDLMQRILINRYVQYQRKVDFLKLQSAIDSYSKTLKDIVSAIANKRKSKEIKSLVATLNGHVSEITAFNNYLLNINIIEKDLPK